MAYTQDSPAEIRRKDRETSDEHWAWRLRVEELPPSSRCHPSGPVPVVSVSQESLAEWLNHLASREEV